MARVPSNIEREEEMGKKGQLPSEPTILDEDDYEFDEDEDEDEDDDDDWEED